MRTPFRSVLLAVAVAVAIAGELTGASIGGEIVSVDRDACLAVAWPWIPAACLEGASRDQVRYVTADQMSNGRGMERRFAVAFD